MKNNIKEIQEFVRRKVIMACHNDTYCKLHSIQGSEHDRNTCDDCYQVALEKELGFGCEIARINQVNWKIITLNEVIYAKSSTGYFITNKSDKIYPISNEEIIKSHIKIIGKPLTLARILKAIIQDERSLATSTADLKVIFHLIYDWDYDLELYNQ